MTGYHLGVDEILEHAYRYNRWANLHLLDVCARLSPKQLELTAPGTYGTIAATWMHLLGAEQRYLRRLGGPPPRINDRSEFPGIAGLRRHAERTGDGLLEAARTIPRRSTGDFTFGHDRIRLSKWTIALQALHHGNDHRTHICTILGAQRIEYGDMDVWSYGAATGHEKLLGKVR